MCGVRYPLQLAAIIKTTSAKRCFWQNLREIPCFRNSLAGLKEKLFTILCVISAWLVLFFVATHCVNPAVLSRNYNAPSNLLSIAKFMEVAGNLSSKQTVSQRKGQLPVNSSFHGKAGNVTKVSRGTGEQRRFLVFNSAAN
jgi:hypothetical protein